MFKKHAKVCFIFVNTNAVKECCRVRLVYVQAFRANPNVTKNASITTFDVLIRSNLLSIC